MLKKQKFDLARKKSWGNELDSRRKAWLMKKISGLIKKIMLRKQKKTSWREWKNYLLWYLYTSVWSKHTNVLEILFPFQWRIACLSASKINRMGLTYLHNGHCTLEDKRVSSSIMHSWIHWWGRDCLVHIAVKGLHTELFGWIVGTEHKCINCSVLPDWDI